MSEVKKYPKREKGYKGIPMEGFVAKWYARVTLSDLKRHKHMAEKLRSHIPAGGRVLEVAPGPGYFCIELAKLGTYEITGLDISSTFVRIARETSAKANVKVDFRQGNASDMPFSSDTFHFVFCQAAFKNFSQPMEALAEMHRVLLPGGTAVIADLRRDASPSDIDREVDEMGLNPINRWFTKQTFRTMLLKNAYTTGEMESFAGQTPFRQFKVEVDGIGFLAWLEK
jgi:ubiquinone/menaquinone biosynthesis C-methylase UbiE